MVARTPFVFAWLSTWCNTFGLSMVFTRRLVGEALTTAPGIAVGQDFSYLLNTAEISSNLLAEFCRNSCPGSVFLSVDSKGAHRSYNPIPRIEHSSFYHRVDLTPWTRSENWFLTGKKHRFDVQLNFDP